MAIDVNDQVPKNWVHEPERLAAEKAEKIQRLLKTAEVPGALGGLALLFLGRKVSGASGNAIAALGSTLLMSAAGRFAYRKSSARLQSLLPFPGAPEPDAAAATP